VKHGEAIKPVIISLLAYLELGRAVSEKSALKPHGDGAVDGQIIDASLGFKRGES
jgi:hypothetical protein